MRAPLSIAVTANLGRTALLPWMTPAAPYGRKPMYPGSALTRLDRRLLLVMVLAVIIGGLVLAAATGHTAVPQAATAIEYGL
jgi:hypothetical protein